MRSAFFNYNYNGIKITVLFVLASFFCGAGPVLAQNKAARAPKPAAYHTPKPGSAERRAIMDALRAPVQKEVETPIIFVIHDASSLRVVGDWAFVSAQYVNPDGSQLGKAYWVKFNDMSDDVQALLHRVKGKWKVVTYVVAVTDVEWEDWPQKYHAPKAVVPSTR